MGYYCHYNLGQSVTLPNINSSMVALLQLSASIIYPLHALSVFTPSVCMRACMCACSLLRWDLNLLLKRHELHNYCVFSPLLNDSLKNIFWTTTHQGPMQRRLPCLGANTTCFLSNTLAVLDWGCLAQWNLWNSPTGSKPAHQALLACSIKRSMCSKDFTIIIFNTGLLCTVSHVLYMREYQSRRSPELYCNKAWSY